MVFPQVHFFILALRLSVSTQIPKSDIRNAETYFASTYADTAWLYFDGTQLRFSH